jgi:hypothetical protein
MIIGVGHLARSGKDTIATHLVNNYAFIQESFAYPLKEHIGRQICGLTDKQLYGNLKEVIDQRYGMTPRELLQKIGTDAMRDIVHPDFWVIPARKKLIEHISKGQNVIWSDVRMINEAEMVKEFDGKLIRIDRKNAEVISSPKHKSELELVGYNGWDAVVDNNGSIEELFLRVDELMKGWKK